MTHPYHEQIPPMTHRIPNIMAQPIQSLSLENPPVRDQFQSHSRKQEIEMGKQLGLWIDHRQATIVTVTKQGEEIHELLSEVETQLRRSGDSPWKGSYEALQVPADDSRQRALTGELNTYYDKVIGQIQDADSILIIGPGAAKHELQKRLEEKRLGGKVVGVETVDLLTEPQLAAKVRQHFAA